jgi:hypothetical protein
LRRTKKWFHGAGELFRARRREETIGGREAPGAGEKPPELACRL